MFRATRAGVLAELDAVEQVALAGVLAEVRAAGDHPVLAELAGGVAAAHPGVAALDAAAARRWLVALRLARDHLGAVLALADLDPADAVGLAGQLAVDSPVRTTARAWLWLGDVAGELAAALP